LQKKTEAEYGSEYRAHLLELYKTYGQTVEKISDRRQSANTFFLGINTAVIGLVGCLQSGSNPAETEFYWLISLSGMVLCYSWFRVIRSYWGLNSGKFRVIHVIERELPVVPYDAEWVALGRGKDPERYLPFTRLESVVPWVFFLMHAVVFVQATLALITH
jgi:hypothetical protein